MTGTPKSNRRTSGDLPAKVEINALAFDVFTDEDQKAALSLGITLHGSVDVCLERSVNAQNSATVLTLEAGYLLLKAKADTPHGDFENGLKKRGVDPQRARELMRTAKFYTGLTPEQRVQVFSLGKSKLQLLSGADQEVIQDLLEAPDAELDSLSVRGLRQRIQGLEKDRANLGAKLEVAESKLKRQQRTTFTSRTEEVRAECMALQLDCELPMNAVCKLYEEINADGANTPEWRYQAEQLYVTAHIIAARAMDMLARVQEMTIVDDMPGRIESQHILSPEEAERWLHDAPMIESKYEAKRVARAAANEEKRGRGRPAGSGKKEKKPGGKR